MPKNKLGHFENFNLLDSGFAKTHLYYRIYNTARSKEKPSKSDAHEVWWCHFPTCSILRPCMIPLKLDGTRYFLAVCES